MVGYSSVMHMGYAFLGIAAASALGVGGVVLMMIAHGFSVALLFLLATSIHHRTQTFDMAEMGGLAKNAPILAALFVAATFASIGLPGFANFWGELTIFVALWNFSHWMTIAAVAGIIISAIYGLRAASRVFFGPPTEPFAKVAAARPPADMTWSEKVPALVLLAALVLLGVWPKLLSDPINAQITAAMPNAQPATMAQPVGASLATPGLDNANGVVSSSPGLATKEPTLETMRVNHVFRARFSCPLRPLCPFRPFLSDCGCAALGNNKKITQPQRGCVQETCDGGRNPVGVDEIFNPKTQGSPRGLGQPWAVGQNPVGVSPSTPTISTL